MWDLLSSGKHAYLVEGTNVWTESSVNAENVAVDYLRIMSVSCLALVGEGSGQDVPQRG
jgi:hypothetical protein